MFSVQTQTPEGLLKAATFDREIKKRRTKSFSSGVISELELSLIIAEIGNITGGLDFELHILGDDEELARAVTLPFAAGQFGLERASHDVHVLDTVGAETVFAGFDHAHRGGAVSGAHGETLNVAFKIGIMFHARDLMPFCGAFINKNRTLRTIWIHFFRPAISTKIKRTIHPPNT